MNDMSYVEIRLYEGQLKVLQWWCCNTEDGPGQVSPAASLAFAFFGPTHPASAAQLVAMVDALLLCQREPLPPLIQVAQSCVDFAIIHTTWKKEGKQDSYAFPFQDSPELIHFLTGCFEI